MKKESTVVRVLFFSYLKDIMGTSEIELDAKSVNTVADIIAQISEGRDDIGKMLPFLRYAVNQKYCPDTHLVNPGDEVAIITPVSGG